MRGSSRLEAARVFEQTKYRMESNLTYSAKPGLCTCWPINCTCTDRFNPLTLKPKPSLIVGTFLAGNNGLAGGWGYVRLKDLGLVLCPGRGLKTRAFKGYVRMYRGAGGT